MSIMWGPALDAELEYRREQLLAADPPGRYRRGALVPRAAGTSRGLRRLLRRRPATAATSPASSTATARVTGDAADARQWVLPGSGAWHVAP